LKIPNSYNYFLECINALSIYYEKKYLLVDTQYTMSKYVWTLIKLYVQRERVPSPLSIFALKAIGLKPYVFSDSICVYG